MVTFFTSSELVSSMPSCIVTTHPKNSLISLRNATSALPTIASAGAELPSPVKALMRLTSKLMTRSVYRL